MRVLPGYVHIDIINHPHIDYVHNVTNLEMFDDNSVELIYASHLLEHFYKDEAHRAVKEWYRILSPGGTLRLAVPNLDTLIHVYKTYNDIDLIAGPLYGHCTTTRSNEVPHRYIYTKDTLCAMLQTIGYKHIREWDWRKVFTRELLNFDDYSQAYVPHMDKDHGILISLNLEAEK